MSHLFSRHKQTIIALLIGFLYSATIAFATPPGSPYSAGETLDPTCIPGATNCTVTISAVGIPGGSDTQIQFNDAGLLAGSASFVWDKTNSRLGIGDNTPAASLTVGASDAFQVNDQGRVTVGRGTSDPTGAAGSLYYRTDTNTLRLYDTSWQDLPTNSYLGTNFYNKDELATDGSSSVSWTNITNAPTIAANSDTQLLNGGQVSYVSGYSFNVSAASYKILGTTYNSVETPVTLGAADPTFDRIDVIAVNTSGNTLVINGTPSASPQKPYVDPDTQLELTFITVGANTVAPSITELSIYAENAGTPTEWNRSSNNAAIVLNSAASPRNGTVSINGTSVPTNARLTFSPPTPFDINSTTQLVLYIKSKANWGNNRKLSVAFANATGQKGNAISINRTGSFGFDSASTAAYQQVVIPISNFAVPAGTLVTQMTITALGNQGTLGFYIDDLSLEAGTPLVSTNSFTVNTANSPSITITGNGLVSSPLTATLNGTYIDGNYFKQNGNAFSGLATLGTTDNNALAFKTNNLERFRITATGRMQLTNTNNNVLLGGGNDSMTGANNILLGTSAGTSMTTGNDNFFAGQNAGLSATSDVYYSTFIGNNAGSGATNAAFSNFFGQNAGASATNAVGSNFFGGYAGSGATNASSSNFFGYAGTSATNANNSNFFGSITGIRATNASYSNFFGTYSGYEATNANNSNFFGHGAGYQASAASYSNLFGLNVGSTFFGSGSNEIGSNNIIIGTNISLPDATANAINLGGVLFGSGTYATTTGNPSITAVSTGKIGIGLVSPAYRFDVLNSNTAQTATNRVSNVSNSGSTFNTTAGALSSYGTYTSSTSTKSAGSNSLTNVGLYSTASGADANYAAIFDQGNVGVGTTAPTSKLTVNGTTQPTGSELVTNGTFTGSATGWTLGDCAAYGSGQVVVTYTACGDPTIETTISTVAGTTYLLSFTLSGVSLDEVEFWFGNNWPDNQYTRRNEKFIDGVNTVAFKASFTGSQTITFSPSNYTNGGTWTIDNVSIKTVTVTPSVYATSFDGGKALSVGDILGSTSLGISALSSLTGVSIPQGDGTDNTAVGAYSLFRTQSGQGNTALGAYSLFSNTTGGANIAVGKKSLYLNTTGYNITAIGSDALSNNTTGSFNVAVGNSSLGANTTGEENTAVGLGAMGNNTTGNKSIGIGNYAIGGNTTATNIGIGYNVMFANQTGTANTAIGTSAGYSNRNGGFNVFLGHEAAYGSSFFSSPVSNTVILGYRAGYNVRTGADNNILVGYQAGDALTTGAKNIIIGHDIDAPSATGSNQLSIGNIIFGTGVTGTGTTIAGNIGIGLNNPIYRFDVLNSNTAQTATNRVANFSNASSTFDTTAGALSSYGGYFSSTSTRSAGANALTNVGLYATASGAQTNLAAHIDGILRLGSMSIENPNTSTSSITIGGGNSTFTGTNNIIIGVGAGAAITTASNNFFAGQNAGASVTSGASNSTFIGDSSGYQATNAQYSNFFGAIAGYQATNSFFSNFLGLRAGSLATNANNSNFFGSDAGSEATNANDSNFFGGAAGEIATYANGSNFFGNTAGGNATNASYSNFLGQRTGYLASNASYSNFFGYQAGKTFTSNNLGSNNIIIGTNISLPDATANAINLGGVLFGTGTYSTTTGNPSITPVSGGKIGIGVVSPSYTLQVGNSSVTGIVSRFENSTGTCDINPTTSTLSCSSDINLKKNITTINTDAPFILRNDLASTTYTKTLNKIMNLTPVVYNWNSESDTDSKHAGFIAQEVEQIFPDLVTTDSVTGLKSLGYTGLIPYTIEAIQELGIEVEGMKGLEKDTPLRTRLIAWFADLENGINSFFAKEVKTEKLCINDSTGEVCITKDQLYQMVQGQTNPQPASSSTIETTQPVVDESVISEPISPENTQDPAPESVPQEAPVE